ncbi:MAG: NADH-quinone oxidoreductase subunit N, partial [Deltaproteobacteria bacterium]|nr:NADH-quinone oxidoreductase subunit N [Deltaproteobacteria bacterium]
ATGSLDLGVIAQQITQHGISEATIVAVVCILAGFGYKISAAPFHMWAPDVYEGSPTPITAFFSVGPKAAGFAVILRFFHDALGTGAALDANTEVPWPMIVGLLAIATMTVGNLSALGQKSVKRMLAYSSIAHAGYMLLGVVAFSDRGASAVVFYIAVYCFMNLGAFLVVLAVAEKTGKETLDAYEGLGFRAPGLAAAMALFLFSLTGLPPMAGFVGKFYLFSALVERGGDLNAFLAVIGVVNSVVSLFYYARVLRAMYLAKPAAPAAIEVRKSYGWTVGLLAVPTLVLGVYWAPVYDFISRSLVMLR